MTHAEFHHVGLTVSNIEQSIEYYARFLGFTRPTGVVAVTDEWISGVTGLPGTDLRVAFLTNGAVTLELIEYIAPPGRSEVETITADAGSAHLAVTVADIESLFEEMEQAGVEYVSRPQLVTSGGWTGRKLAYLKDPDGGIVELVQEAGS